MKKIILSFIVLFLFSCTHEVRPGQLSSGPQAKDAGAIISGEVSLANGIEARGEGVLFIMVRQKGVKSGPPLAVKRLQNPVFPIGFQMSQANVMIKSSRFQGDLELTAKWTQDGNPITNLPGDLGMTSPQQAVVGTSRDMKVVLDRKM
jgi:cytochrome c-type biogenesis protein CcmH